MTGSVAGSHVLDLYETFEPPPRGFDVHSAPARALHKHGLPQRPDAASHRRLDQSWQRQTSVAINARPDIQSLGASAEWIIEMVSPDLPAFDPVTFNGCAAATDSHLIDLRPFGSALDIVTSDEVFLTQSTIASETSAIVRWEGWK